MRSTRAGEHHAIDFCTCFSDIDILCHWLAPDTPVHVSSFGGLQHFRKSGKPAEAGDATRCLDCTYEAQCPYSAKKGRSPSFNSTAEVLNPQLVYLDRVASGHVGWPVSTLVDEIPDIENVTDAIQNGPYGGCVYENDNDVCDHQVLLLSSLPHLPPTNHAPTPRSSTFSMRQAQPCPSR